MKYTEEELTQMELLCTELLSINEELNARIIAMNAKLENEEKKVIRLSQQLAQLSLMFTNKTYEG
jgi:hypothetical protein